jgi:hypothetical protein
VLAHARAPDVNWDMFARRILLRERVRDPSYRRGGCPGPCDERLVRAATGTGSFRPVKTFRSPSQGIGVELAGAGDDLYAIGPGHVAGGGRDAYSRLSISTDSGRTWRLHADPCRTARDGEFDTGQIVAAGRYLGLLCIPRLTTGTAADRNRRASIMLSADAGRTFTRLRRRPPIALSSWRSTPTATSHSRTE